MQSQAGELATSIKVNSNGGLLSFAQMFRLPWHWRGSAMTHYFECGDLCLHDYLYYLRHAMSLNNVNNTIAKQLVRLAYV